MTGPPMKRRRPGRGSAGDQNRQGANQEGQYGETAEKSTAAISLAYRRRYPLRPGLAVEFVMDGGKLDVHWLPKCPKHNRVSRKLLRRYRNARNDFLASLGVNALVIEV